ncbi:MAG: type III secretion system chaperone [Waddliaceae bacterium]
MLDTLMQQLAKELDIEESPATEVPGVYAIPIDEDLSAMIAEIPRGFSITCTVADSPRENEEEFFSQALLANLFGEGTDGCTLGLTEDGGKLVLSFNVDYEVTVQEFMDIVEDFLNAVDLWREEVRAYGTKIA